MAYGSFTRRVLRFGIMSSSNILLGTGGLFFFRISAELEFVEDCMDGIELSVKLVDA
jgi:hypothetical protein